MVSHCQLTVQLNNRGVAYLEKGNLNRSFTLFRDALRNTMAQLRDAAPSSPEDSAANKGTTATQTTAATATAASSAQVVQVWKSKGMKAFASAKSLRHRRNLTPCEVMFSQGITLMEESGAYSTDNVVDLTVASSIVLFNLALIHHIKGLNENSSKYLFKAESFYCRSYQLLVDTGLTLGCSCNPVIDFLSMALLNNAAQVGRELCHSELSREQFRQLIVVASQVNSESYGDLSIATFMEEIKTNFLLNAIVLQDQNVAAAA